MLANWAAGFQLFRTAFNFFYNRDPSVKRALKLKQVVAEEWHCMAAFTEK